MMSTRKSLSEKLQKRWLPWIGVIAIVIAGIAALVDWLTWIELNESIVFSLPLILAGASRSRRLLWSLAVFLAATTFVVYYIQTPAGVFSIREPFFVNRVLSFVTLMFSAGLLHAWMRAMDALEARGRDLKVQNLRLDAANRELVRCQAEITRQNEELDRRRKEAEEASGSKTRLLASVSHDIRSPLNAINLMAQLLRRTVDEPALRAEIPGLAQRLQSSAASLADVVADSLDFSALESGRVELHETEFALNDFLTEECRRLLPLAQAKKLRLAIETGGPSLRLRTDRVKLGRIVNNLVTNAIKFTESGGVTLCAAQTPEQDVLIRVCDTGIGIAPENLGRIFHEFEQLRDPDHDRNQGWGLGLSICRRLVEVMGGEISVESQVGQGSVFTVCLPASCIVEQSRPVREASKVIGRPAVPK